MFSGLLRPHPFCQAACRGIGGCIVGAIAGFLLSEAPWLAKCLAGIVTGSGSQGVSLACNALCEGDPGPNVACSLVNIILSTLFGCVTSGVDTGGPGGDILKFLTNLVLSAFGTSLSKICSDTGKWGGTGIPVLGPPGPGKVHMARVITAI